jgi:hypothetical protein
MAVPRSADNDSLRGGDRERGDDAKVMFTVTR